LTDAVAAEALAAGITDLGLSIPRDARELMLAHCAAVREANERLNLTRITDPPTMVRDHVVDALALLAALRDAGLSPPPDARLLDVGTGAGFPGIPLALANPGWRVLLLDSRRKKAAFLLHAVHEVGIPRVEVLDVRASEIPLAHPELTRAFDLVTARAVGRQDAVLHEVADLVRPGGLLVHFKGPRMTSAERAAGTVAAGRLGFERLPDIPTPQPGRDRRFVVDRAAV
jgi:16S rRNA (guanine527-N7)-methyltransferase